MKIDEIKVKYHNINQLTNLEYYKTKQIVDIEKQVNLKNIN